MATKRVKKQIAAQQTPTEKAQAFWLAGLGAVSIAQKRGDALFTNLIGEGKDFQSRATKLAREIRIDTKAQVKGVLAPIKARARYETERAGEAVQQGVGVVLGKLGIPSKADIAELTTRVTALSRQLKASR